METRLVADCSSYSGSALKVWPSLGFSVIPRHPGLTDHQSSMCSQISSPNMASHPGQENRFHTDLVGGNALVAVSVDFSHWIQIQQMWTECLLWVRPWQQVFHASFPILEANYNVGDGWEVNNSHHSRDCPKDFACANKSKIQSLLSSFYRWSNQGSDPACGRRGTQTQVVYPKPVSLTAMRGHSSCLQQ